MRIWPGRCRRRRNAAVRWTEICAERHHQERERLGNQKQSLLTEQSKLVQEMERDALEIKREALRLTHLCETALAWDAEEVLIPVQQAAEQVQRTYARLSSGECAIFSQEQTVFEDARQAAAALSDALVEGGTSAWR